MINNIEKIEIINYKISRLKDIYDANLINIANPDSITSESDYQLDVCYRLKSDLELQIEALKAIKESLTNQQ